MAHCQTGVNMRCWKSQRKDDKINAAISLRFGDENSLTDKTDAGNLLAEMLKTGTTTKTKEQISDELDRIKTDISFFGGPGNLSSTINTDKKNLPAALALLDDMLLHPKFDQDEFEKLLIETKAGYETNMHEPISVAFRKVRHIAEPLSRRPSIICFYN